MKNRLLLVARTLLLLVPLSATACGDDKEDETKQPQEHARHGLTADEAAQVLAKVGDETITLGDFADEVARQSPYLRGRFQSYEKRKEYLDSMVRFKLLAQEAARRGLMKHPTVQRERRKLLEQQLISDQVDDKLAAEPVAENDIKAHYEANKSEYQKPAQRRIAHILLKSPAAANELLKELGEKPDDAAFKKAAATKSADKESGSRFGDLGFHTHPSNRAEGETEAVPDAVLTAAFELEELGQIYARPVRSELGFHLVRLTAKRDAFSRTLEQASRSIRAQLEKERRDEALKELTTRLRREANVKIHEDALQKLIAEYAPESTVSAVSAKQDPKP